MREHTENNIHTQKKHNLRYYFFKRRKRDFFFFEKAVYTYKVVLVYSFVLKESCYICEKEKNKKRNRINDIFTLDLGWDIEDAQ